MKSKYKPFSILRAQDNPRIDVYSGEIRRNISVFPWWNHWPVAQKPTDGRWAMAADRPAHSSLSHWFWDHYAMSDRSMTKLLLTGMTDRTAEELLDLGRSWYNAPLLKANRMITGVYDQAQRAYVLSVSENMNSIGFTLNASGDSPLINPAFVIKDWGSKSTKIMVDGKSLPLGKDARIGQNVKLNGMETIIWLQMESRETVKVRFFN